MKGAPFAPPPASGAPEHHKKKRGKIMPFKMRLLVILSEKGIISSQQWKFKRFYFASKRAQFRPEKGKCLPRKVPYHPG